MLYRVLLCRGTERLGATFPLVVPLCDDGETILGWYRWPFQEVECSGSREGINRARDGDGLATGTMLTIITRREGLLLGMRDTECKELRSVEHTV